MAKIRGDENGYGLFEALASMAILAVAAAMFMAGMLGALRLQMDARRKRMDLSGLERAVIEEEPPEKYEELELSIVFGGIRLDAEAKLGIYESGDEKLSLSILIPKASHRAENANNDEE